MHIFRKSKIVPRFKKKKEFFSTAKFELIFIDMSH